MAHSSNGPHIPHIPLPSFLAELLHVPSKTKVEDKVKDIYNQIVKDNIRTPYFIWRGIKYAAINCYVWKTLFLPFLVFIGISIAVFILTFILLYKPQQKYLDKFGSDTKADESDVYAFYLVIQEAKFFSNVIFMVILDIIRRKIYDLMFEKEIPDLPYKKLSLVPTKDRLKILFYTLALTLGLDLLTSFFLTVPFGGQIINALLKGWALAWMYQAAYLESLGFNFLQQAKWVSKNFIAYELFGAIAALLLYIPILSWIFYFTNLCGAALWAMQMTVTNHKFMQAIKEHEDEEVREFHRTFTGEDLPEPKQVTEASETSALLVNSSEKSV